MKAPIRTWQERVDDEVVAVVAFVEFVFRGGYHAATAFRLVDRGRVPHYEAREIGEETLLQHLDRHHGGHVPYLRRVRDDHAPVLRARDVDEGLGDDG